MFDEIMEKIDSMGFFCDGIIAIDLQGYICCCRTNHTNAGNLYHTDEIIGKHLFEAYPLLNATNSTLYKALRGIPTYNFLQRHLNFQGEAFSSYETTLPLKSGGRIIGAVSFTKFEERLPHEIQLEEKSPEEIAVSEAIQQLVGDSFPMQMVKMRIQQIAKSDSGVLLYGATGTGKGVAAKAIHEMSFRSSQSFIEQNCAAIPPNLLESLFFGTVKGSYTGAGDSEGIFRRCNGGTLFLDEINSMDLNLQAKLLKVLESGEVTPLGGRKSYPIDVRVIAATNEHPMSCVQSGKIRSDLFFRLSAVQLEMPSLTQRLSDIPLLCDYFITQYRRQTGRQVRAVASDVLELFRQYSWPGNVRELKNLIEGAFVYAADYIIQKTDLPEYLFDPRWNLITSEGFVSSEQQLQPSLKDLAETNDAKDGISSDFSFGDSSLPDDLSLKEAMFRLEKRLLQHRMQLFKTKKALAANLGISRQALDIKLRKYELG